MRDQHGRELDHLRISLTDRCNMRCNYCMPAGEATCTPADRLLSDHELVRIVERLVGDCGIRHLRLTGGEPTVRPGLLRLVERLARLPVADLAMTTNGLRLTALAAPLRAAGLRRLNISLDSLRPQTLARISPGTSLTQILEGIAAARRAGFADLKFNAVLMRGVNDAEILDLIRFAAEQGGVMRFIEVMPIGVLAGRHQEFIVSAAQIRARVAEAYRAEPEPRPAGSPAQVYQLRALAGGAPARYGIIASETEPFCGDCRRLRLTAEGRLMACLFRDEGIDLRGWVWRHPEDTPAATADFHRQVAAAMALKPIRRELQVKHPMHVLGG